MGDNVFNERLNALEWWRRFNFTPLAYFRSSWSVQWWSVQSSHRLTNSRGRTHWNDSPLCLLIAKVECTQQTCSPLCQLRFASPEETAQLRDLFMSDYEWRWALTDLTHNWGFEWSLSVSMLEGVINGIIRLWTEWNINIQKYFLQHHSSNLCQRCSRGEEARHPATILPFQCPCRR